VPLKKTRIRKQKMDELMREMGTMSVHCGESEYAQLDSAVSALGRVIPDHAALAALCARLAVRYLEQIDNLSGTHRKMLVRVVQLEAARKPDAACGVASVVLRQMHRASDRYDKRGVVCKKWRRMGTRPY
jgi:hypothetical protein